MKPLKDFIIGLFSTGTMVALVTGIFSFIGDKLNSDRTLKIKELEVENENLKKRLDERGEEVDFLRKYVRKD